MSPSTLRYALFLSLLLNFGVIGAVGYQSLRQGGLPAMLGGPAATDLAEYLKLDAGQRTRWHALEEDFLRELDAGWREIAAHREQLIREVFAEQPNGDRIESERARIAQLQVEQQRRVIAQFLQERDILNAKQRQALAELLLRESPAAPLERRLHSR
jgi:heavy-metal resistance protein